MNRVISPPATLAVIGGGQLGRMFIQAAQGMGYRGLVVCDSPGEPAAQVAHETVLGSDASLATLHRVANSASAVTVEFENVSSSSLRWLSRKLPVRPGWKTVRISQNRLREKGFLAKHGFPLAPWRPVRSEGELSDAVASLGLPLILKTADSGYDGKGQVRIRRPEDASSAWAKLGRVCCVAEGVVDFAAEISVIVVRGADGESDAYPPCLNRHSHHILDSTIIPAPIGPFATMSARSLALGVADALGTVGVLTVEFFLSSDGSLAINEVAPRPHNSGHATIEAAVTSQFEQQVRATCGLPIGSTDLVSPVGMVNLLGDLWSAGNPRWDRALRSDRGLKLHLYGKKSAKPGRKMGHLTVLDPDPQRALERALAARRLLVPAG
jgi:5-(carboxyamino)imidazole ribonucleotide synthase